MEQRERNQKVKMKIIDQTLGQLGMELGWYNASASANAATNAMCTTVTRV